LFLTQAYVHHSDRKQFSEKRYLAGEFTVEEQFCLEKLRTIGVKRVTSHALLLNAVAALRLNMARKS
jgi:hypothetical protein